MLMMAMAMMLAMAMLTSIVVTTTNRLTARSTSTAARTLLTRGATIRKTMAATATIKTTTGMRTTITIKTTTDIMITTTQAKTTGGKSQATNRHGPAQMQRGAITTTTPMIMVMYGPTPALTTRGEMTMLGATTITRMTQAMARAATTLGVTRWNPGVETTAMATTPVMGSMMTAMKGTSKRVMALMIATAT